LNPGSSLQNCEQSGPSLHCSPVNIPQPNRLGEVFYCIICRFSETVHRPQRLRSRQNTAGSHDIDMSDSRSQLLSSMTELNDDELQVHVISKQKKPSLLRVLMYVVGPKLLQAHMCKLVADILIFCGPLLQRFASLQCHCDSDVNLQANLSTLF